MTAAPEARDRLDRWLWCARFYRRREDAAEAIRKGHIRIERAGGVVRADKPGLSLACGDVLCLARGGTIRRVRVCGFRDRRGSADDALSLFEELGGS